jgi:transposase
MLGERSVYAGLDAGSTTCHLVALDSRGSPLVDRTFTTTQKNLISAIEEVPGRVSLHIESCELAGWIRRVLRSRVKRIVVGHAKTNAWIAKDPLKKDRVDATKLADLLRMGRVHEVYYPDQEDRALFKQTVQHYDDLTDQQIRVKHKIKSRYRVQGVIPRGERVYLADRDHWLEKIGSGPARDVLEQLYALLDATLVQQKAALKLMRQQAKKYPEIALFRKVPGMETILASRFSAYVQTPHRFGSKRKLWRYCRLGITDRSSDGKALGRQALDRNGNGRLKDLSFKAFVGAMRCRKENQYQLTYRRTLSRTHNKTHARLSVQRKILATLLSIWKTGETYRDDWG